MEDGKIAGVGASGSWSSEQGGEGISGSPSSAGLEKVERFLQLLAVSCGLDLCRNERRRLYSLEDYHFPGIKSNILGMSNDAHCDGRSDNKHTMTSRDSAGLCSMFDTSSIYAALLKRSAPDNRNASLVGIGKLPLLVSCTIFSPRGETVAARSTRSLYVISENVTRGVIILIRIGSLP